MTPAFMWGGTLGLPKLNQPDTAAAAGVGDHQRGEYNRQCPPVRQPHTPVPTQMRALLDGITESLPDG